MAIAVDATSSAYVSSGATANCTHVCTGSNGLLLADICLGNTHNDDIGTVTYNGVAMTQIAKRQNQGNGRPWQYTYALMNPSTGSHTIAVGLSTGTHDDTDIIGTSYTGCDQTTNPEANSGGDFQSGTSAATSVTTLTDQAWAHLFLCDRAANTLTASTNSTLRKASATNPFRAAYDSNGPITPAGSFSMTITSGGTLNAESIIVAIKPIGGYFPGAGTVAISGTAPAIRTAVPAGAGSVAISGLAPAPRFALYVAAAAITLTGYAPTITNSRTVAPGVGAATISGAAPSVNVGIGVPAGALSLTGYAPGVNDQDAVPVGSIALTGRAPSTQIGITRVPGVGAVAIAGLAPTVTVHGRAHTDVFIAGVQVSTAMLPGATIHEVLGPTPNTARISFTADPGEGSAIDIYHYDVDNNRTHQFGGEIQTTALTYLLRQEHSVWIADAVDQSFRANKLRPFGTFADESGSDVAIAIAAYAPECTSTGIQTSPPLPNVSLIFDGTENTMTCLQRVAVAVGGGCRAVVTYDNDIGIFQADPAPAPDPIDDAHPPLNDRPITFTDNLAQIRTRVYGKGYTGTLAAGVAAGETILPVGLADAVMYNAAGGQVIAGTTAGAAQSEILSYTGVTLGGSGSLAGPGAGPTVAPVATPSAGSGLTDGVYTYAYTDVTAAGESLPSPLGTMTAGIVDVGFIANPSTAAQLDTIITGNPDYGLGIYIQQGGSATGVYIAIAFTNAVGQTGAGPSVYIDMTGFTNPTHFSVKNIPTGPSGTTGRIVYMYEVVNGTSFLYKDTIANNSATTWTTPSSPTFVGNTGFPTANTTGTPTAYNQGTITGIATGATGTTSRNLYRTVVNGSQLKFVATIAGNSSTGPYVDSTPDGSLGANAPTSDTSGLSGSIVPGNILAGATSALLSSAGPFTATGGWAISGPNLFRYTGISGNTLTGIPPSGPGAIATTINYGDQVVSSAALTGVTKAGSPTDGTAVALAAGSTVAIWVQRDDLDAQAVLAQLERKPDGTPSTGIREDTVSDGRLGETALTAKVDAALAAFSRVIVGTTYSTLDLKTHVGGSVQLNMSGKPSGSYLIQDVVKTFFGATNEVRFDVKAQSVAFTLRDFVQSARIVA